MLLKKRITQITTIVFIILSILLSLILVVNTCNQTKNGDYELIETYSKYINFQNMAIYNNSKLIARCDSDNTINSLEKISQQKTILNISFSKNYTVRIHPEEISELVHFGEGFLIWQLSHYIIYCIALIVVCLKFKHDECFTPLFLITAVFTPLIFLIYIAIANYTLFITKSVGFPNGGSYRIISSNNTNQIYDFVDNVDLISKMINNIFDLPTNKIKNNIKYFEIYPNDYNYQNITIFGTILYCNYLIISILTPIIIYYIHKNDEGNDETKINKNMNIQRY